MKNEFRISLLNASGQSVAVFLLMLLFLQVWIPAAGQRNSLVSAEWLFNNLDDPGLVIIDASPAQAYKAGHIPGAVSYDLFSYGPRELPVDEVGKSFRSWGISPGKKVIIYDQGGTMLATRLIFSLDYYGFPQENIFLLDGGISKWKEAGYKMTADIPPAPDGGTFTIGQLNKAVRADLSEFLNASGDRDSNVLVEALDPAWHYGDMNVFGRKGHIPNAIMLPVNDFYNPDKTFKSNEEIRKMLDYLGIERDKVVYTHCGGGIAASVPYFAMKHLLGWKDVKLFPGSQLEWAMDERELPLWTYDAPYLIRDAGWLQGWGGRMMRMYGISNLGLVDVRSEEAFASGHIEFAVNLKPEVLKSSMTNPDEFVNALTMAGIDVTSEAIIISGGGLTKEAALAFVALEKAGQKKISVFMDNANSWEQSGFKLTTDKSEKQAGQVKNPDKIRVVNTVLPDDGILDIFPGVIIECGEKESALKGDKKRFHVHYKDLLNSDGTPKKAGEIWTVLSKAGVPRYAGLACYSDDPGEAAIVSFVLKLMGFPAVSVMLPDAE